MTIMVVDAEAFSRLRNPQQLIARRQLYAVLHGTFHAMGVPWQQCLHEDRGDGALVLIPPSVPKPVVVRGLLSGLGNQLLEVAGQEGRPAPRMRVALHAGEVHFDQHGVTGGDVNHAFRLADSAALRQALKQTRAGFAVIVSDSLYQGTIVHRYDGLDPVLFYEVDIHVKEAAAIAWLTTPGDEECARRVAARPRSQASQPPAEMPDAGVSIQAGGSVTLNGSDVAGRDIWNAR
jgi:hypothetical protein